MYIHIHRRVCVCFIRLGYKAFSLFQIPSAQDTFKHLNRPSEFYLRKKIKRTKEIENKNAKPQKQTEPKSGE